MTTLTDEQASNIIRTRNALETAYMTRKKGQTYFLFEDLQLDWDKSEIKDIVSSYNKGEHIMSIAERYGADPDEIFLVLFDQARRRASGKPKLNINQLVVREL